MGSNKAMYIYGLFAIVCHETCPDGINRSSTIYIHTNAFVHVNCKHSCTRARTHPHMQITVSIGWSVLAYMQPFNSNSTRCYCCKVDLFSSLYARSIRLSCSITNTFTKFTRCKVRVRVRVCVWQWTSLCVRCIFSCKFHASECTLHKTQLSFWGKAYIDLHFASG